jgi:ABC-type transport system involved in multi-copper enzyme maturation permease subunit
MATITTSDVRPPALPPATGHAGLRGVVASEFTKLRSVRSTYWTLGALLIVSVGIGVAVMAGQSSSLTHNPGNKAGFDGTQVSLIPFFEIGQLVIAVLGALTITSEYSTGMIRTSLTAMPRRGLVYAAKAIVFTTVTLVIALVTSFVAFFAGQAMVAGTGVGASLFGNVKIPANAIFNGPGSPGSPPKVTFQGTDVISASTVLSAVIGTALFVTLVAVIAFGLGAIIRHTAGTITTVIGIMFVIPILVQLLPDNWRWDITRFFPDAAGRVISVTVPGGGNPHLWSSWPQMIVTACYAVGLLAIGAYLFRKRDA